MEANRTLKFQSSYRVDERIKSPYVERDKHERAVAEKAERRHT